MRNATRRGLPALVLALALTVAGCGDSGNDGDNDELGDGPDNADGTAVIDELIISQAVDLSTFDPTTTTLTENRSVFLQFFDPLIHRTADGELEGVAAESWTQTSDTVLTLELSDGITFENGDPLDAEAVVFTFSRLRDPAVYTGASNFNAITDVRAVEELTVEIETSGPTPTLLASIADMVFIVNPAFYEANDAEFISANPMGSGPYTLESWTRGSEMVLKAKDDYWRGPPAVETVIYKPIPEDSTRVSALLSDEVDMMTNVPFDQIDRIDSSGSSTTTETQGNQSYFVGLRLNTVDALQEKAVRQALNYAVDKQAITERILGGNAVALGGPIPPNVFGFSDTEPYPYDPEKARELLADAGYADGFDLQLDFPSSGLGPGTSDVGTAILGYLADVGINVTSFTAEGSSYTQRMLAEELGTSYLLLLRIGTLDAGTMYDSTLSTEGSYNWNDYTNPELDQILEAARSTLDEDERAVLYAEANELVHEEAPWIFLYNPKVVFGLSTGIDWEPRADTLISVYDDVTASA